MSIIIEKEKINIDNQILYGAQTIIDIQQEP